MWCTHAALVRHFKLFKASQKPDILEQCELAKPLTFEVDLCAVQQHKKQDCYVLLPVWT